MAASPPAPLPRFTGARGGLCVRWPVRRAANGSPRVAAVVCVELPALLSTFSHRLSMAWMPWPPHPRPLSPVSRGRGEDCVFFLVVKKATAPPRPWKGRRGAGASTLVDYEHENEHEGEHDKIRALTFLRFLVLVLNEMVLVLVIEKRSPGCRLFSRIFSRSRRVNSVLGEPAACSLRFVPVRSRLTRGGRGWGNKWRQWS